MDIIKTNQTVRAVMIAVIVLNLGCFGDRSDPQSEGLPDGEVNDEKADSAVSDSSSGGSGGRGSDRNSGGSDANDASGRTRSDAAADSPNGVTFSGTLRSNLDESPVPGVVVKALDSSTLEELGVQATTAADGSFTLESLPQSEVCLLAVGIMGPYQQIDTYTHNVVTDQHYRTIYSVPLTVAELIDNGICGDWRTDLGVVAGSVMYVDEDGDEFPVGCATVEVENATKDATVYYFSGGLPSVGDQSDPTCTNTGAGRLLEMSSNGRFLAVNVPPGPLRINAMVDGEVIGSTILTIRAPEDSTGGQYNHNITRIYTDNIGNPTPNCADY